MKSVDDKGVSRSRCVRILTDVALSSAQLLLSRESLASLGSSICFVKNVLVLNDISFSPLRIIRGCEMSFDLVPNSGHACSSPNIELICESDVTVSSTCPLKHVGREWISEETFGKLHLRPGHCGVGAIQRICDMVNILIDVETGKQRIEKCGRHRDVRIPQCPVVGKHISTEPGEVAVGDITYPCENLAQQHPVLVIVCPMNRFVVSRFSNDVRPETAVQILARNWIQLFGFPKLAICDQGASPRGNIWSEFLGPYGIATSVVPAEARNQVGSCGKQSHLLKTGIRTIRSGMSDRWGNDVILLLTCAARNYCLLSGSGLSPLFIVTGRSDALTWMNTDNIPDEMLRSGDPNPLIARLHAIALERRKSMGSDAERIMDLSRSSVLRAGASDIPSNEAG